MWQNRIVGAGEVAPSSLLSNPKNWRLHPNYQQDAMLAVLEQVGLVSDLVVNQRTGFVIDGHMRLALALQQNQPTVTVTYCDLSDEEEALLLASLDPIALMAKPDQLKLTRLLEDVTPDDARLTNLLGNLRQHSAFIVPPYEGEEIPKSATKSPTIKGDFVSVVIASYRKDVTPEEWRIWQDAITAQVGADRDAVCEEIKRRLQLPKLGNPLSSESEVANVG